MDPITAMAQQTKFGLGQPITALRIIRQYRRVLARAEHLQGRERERYVAQQEAELYRQLRPILASAEPRARAAAAAEERPAHGVERTLKQAHRVRQVLNLMERRHRRAQAGLFAEAS